MPPPFIRTLRKKTKETSVKEKYTCVPVSFLEEEIHVPQNTADVHNRIKKGNLIHAVKWETETDMYEFTY